MCLAVGSGIKLSLKWQNNFNSVNKLKQDKTVHANEIQKYNLYYHFSH